MEKKRSNWFNILIYIIIFAFLGLMIYFLVGYTNQEYRSISTKDGVNLVVNSQDKYDVVAAETYQNGDDMVVNITLNEPYGDSAKYTFSMSAESYYNGTYYTGGGGGGTTGGAGTPYSGYTAAGRRYTVFRRFQGN